MEIVASQEADGLVWPADPDAVPGWVERAERRRAEIGISAPLPARTRRQFDAAVASALRRIESGKPEKVSPDAAAERFVAHVRARASGEPTRYTNEALAAAYRVFCAAQRIECAENFFRAALKLQPGCRREDVVAYRPRRVREVAWVIDAETMTVSTTEQAVAA